MVLKIMFDVDVHQYRKIIYVFAWINSEVEITSYFLVLTTNLYK